MELKLKRNIRISGIQTSSLKSGVTAVYLEDSQHQQ